MSSSTNNYFLGAMTDPAKYDEYYKNPQAAMENGAIKHIISNEFVLGQNVLDIGCGTGNGYNLIKDLGLGYLGIDQNKEAVLRAERKYPETLETTHRFVQMDAKEALKSTISADVILGLFSINYMDWEILNKIIATKKKAILVHYNKPFLKGSASIYRGKREFFERNHSKNQNIILNILNILGQIRVKTEHLLGQPYYYISVITPEINTNKKDNSIPRFTNPGLTADYQVYHLETV